MAEMKDSDLSPNQKVVRRRLVQSTLFPLKPPRNESENCEEKEEEVVEEIDEDDDDDHDEEYCVGRRKRKLKRKGSAQPRRSKKAALNGKGGSNAATDDKDSPVDRSPQTPKAKQRTSTRKGRTNGICGGKIPTDPTANELTSQPIPDLRLEAKMQAEENSRIFAGKQTHPFFSIWKGGKKDQHTDDVRTKSGWAKRKEPNSECGPIHVFENVKGDIDSIDWSNWTFNDVVFHTPSCDFGYICSAFEGSVDSLHFYDILGVSNASQAPHILKDESSDDTPVPLPIVPSGLDNEEAVSCDVLRDEGKDHKFDKFSFIPEDLGRVNSDCGHQKTIFHERIKSCYLNRNNHSEDSLWTAKYHPERALEVCGNGESVKFISEWLQRWHERDLQNYKELCNAENVDCNSYDSDSDAEDIDEAAHLKNVLLMKGPVGCGKSAAVYACAKEQGFQVIEVNASDWRNGALVKQKFGEAVGLHWLKRSQEKPIGLQSKFTVKSFPVACANKAASLKSNADVIALIPLSDQEDLNDAIQTLRSSESQIDCCQGEIKTLILFEDVDANLCEDRGLISTIQQLADTGKRPMILTSNSDIPVLPDNLEREEVSFKMPSLKELLCHVLTICAAEKAHIQPCILERYIQHCQGDIRKTLMHLQFWCQGRSCETKQVSDMRARNMYLPMMFDLEAGHFLLQKLMPWDFPSQLSDLIEREITKSLCERQENYGWLEVIDEERDTNTMETHLDVHQFKRSGINAKKEAMLDRNCYSHDENVFLAVDNACDFSNSSGSPVAFNRRRAHRKFDSVMLSDSDDEISGEGKPAPFGISSKDVDDILVPHEVDPKTDMSYPAPDHPLNLPNGRLLHSGEAKVEEIQHHISEENVNHVNCPAGMASLIHSNDQILHSGWEGMHGIEHQNAETGNHVCYRASGDNLIQSSEASRMLEIAKIDHLNVLSVEDPLKQFNCLFLHSEDTRMENQYQLPETVNVNEVGCSAEDDYLSQLNAQAGHTRELKVTDQINSRATEGPSNTLDGPILKSGDFESEELQHQCSESAKVSHMNDRCQSFDVSCVPESTIVPETLFIDGAEIESRADLMEIQSPAAVVNVSQLDSMHDSSPCDENIDVENEETDDSQSESEHAEASTSGYQVMDECSRIGFRKRSRRLKKPVGKNATGSVQEAWDMLRNSDLTQHVITLEHEDASQVLQLSSRMSNLISEADLLRADCPLLTTDSSDQEIGLEDEAFAFGWQNQQAQMASEIAEHGYCTYVRDIMTLRSKTGLDNGVHLIEEMLARTSDLGALGKLLRQDKGRSEVLFNEKSLNTEAFTTESSHKSEKRTCLEDILHSVVPSRLHMTLRGDAFHEYLSSLAQISRSEASRSSPSVDNPKQRRGRVARNYLSSALALSLDDITELNELNSYGKFSTRSKDANFKVESD